MAAGAATAKATNVAAHNDGIFKVYRRLF